METTELGKQVKISQKYILNVVWAYIVLSIYKWTNLFENGHKFAEIKQNQAKSNLKPSYQFMHDCNLLKQKH